MKYQLLTGRYASMALLLALPLGALPAAVAHATNSPSHPKSASRLVVERINAIRVSDGLVPGAFSTAYAAQLSHALVTSQDPAFPPGRTNVLAEYALWGEIPFAATNQTSPGAVVDFWVSHDGWRGTSNQTWNLDCVAPGAAGCNGHRRAILSRPPAPHAKLTISAVARRVHVGGVDEWRVATLLVWSEAP